MNAPIVKERVYLLPWEDGHCASDETIPKDFQPIPFKIQKAGTICHKLLRLRPQQETEPIDDFFDQPDETDMTQFAIETEFEQDAELDFTTDIFASSESTDQSVEAVMYAYLEAWRNSDVIR